MADSTGPFLTIAALCEQVIIAQDGRMSIINVVEQVTHTRSGPEVPDEMPTFNLPMKSVIALKAGSAKGRYGIKIQPEDPSGATLPAVEHPVQFQSGAAAGVQLIGDIELEIDKEGLYWIDVILVRGRGDAQAQDLLTRMPLNVVYQPQKTIPGPGGNM